MNKTNWLAVVVSAAAGMGLGFLWYGVLFLDTWSSGNGITMSEDESQMFKNGEEVAMSNTPMIVNVIGLLLFAILLDWLIKKTNHTTGAKGAVLGAIIGVFITINIVLSNLFAVNPLSLTVVDSSYVIVLLAIIGFIMGAWRKS